MALDMQASLYWSFLEPGSPLVTGQGCPTNWGCCSAAKFVPSGQAVVEMTLRWTCSVGPGVGGWEANWFPSLCVLSRSAVESLRRPGFGWPSAGLGTFKKGAAGRTVLGEGPRVIVPKPPREAGGSPASRGSSASVCLSGQLCSQDRPPWPAIWSLDVLMVAVPPPGLRDSPGHLLPQPLSSAQRPGWSGGDFVPRGGLRRWGTPWLSELGGQGWGGGSWCLVSIGLDAADRMMSG